MSNESPTYIRDLLIYKYAHNIACNQILNLSSVILHSMLCQQLEQPGVRPSCRRRTYWGQPAARSCDDTPGNSNQ
jgi:hypothetical protein